MLDEVITKRNPMRIFEKCIHGGLGKGNIGVFMARAGIGKTACLIQIALDNLLREKTILHISIGQKLDEIRDWYDELLDDMVHSYQIIQAEHFRDKIESKRMIITYTDKLFDPDRLETALLRLRQYGGFTPDVMLIDGLSFESVAREHIDRMKGIAVSNHLEIWFAVQTHREGVVINERGIPSPCHTIDDLLSVIVFLDPLEDAVRLCLLKDHDNSELEDLHLLLDANTLLIKDETPMPINLHKEG